MKKRIVSLILTFSILLSIIPADIRTALAQDNNILYGDADGNGQVELLDVNLMERYIESDAEAAASIHFTEADVNADGVVDDIDVELVKEYLVGNLASLTPLLATLTFETDGGGTIGPVQAGVGYPYRGEIPDPSKDNYIFVNWQKEDGSVWYPVSDVITADMTLTAVYEPVSSSSELSITSFSLADQPADVSFSVTGSFTDVQEVKQLVTLLPKDGSEPVAFDVRDDGNGSFTIYAPDGFTPGSTYELTLGDGLCFADKEEMYRTAYFDIAKNEVDNLQYNADMIFIQDTAEMRYTVGGQTTDVLESALLSNDESTETISGSFTMSAGQTALQSGDIVCIYENIDPRQRDYTQDDYEDDALAYIRITGVDGNTYQFESLNEEDAGEVLAMPDTIPYQVASLPDKNGTVNRNDYDALARNMLGMETAPAFAVNDFLVFYTDDFESLNAGSSYAYGQITAVDGDTVSYRLVSRQDIEDFMGMFVTQEVDGKSLVDEEQQKEILESIKQQAVESGFAEEVANRMVASALQTEDIQQRLMDIGMTQAEIQTMSQTAASSSGSGSGSSITSQQPFGKRTKFIIDGIDIVPTFIYGEHFDNGVGIALEFCLSMHVERRMPNNQVSQVQIELNAYLEQEVSLGFDVSVEDRWKWYLFIPVLEDLDVTVSIDIQDYTAMSVSAVVYTLRDDIAKKKWEELSETVTGPNASPEMRATIRQINTIAAKIKKIAVKGQNKMEDGITVLEDSLATLKATLPGVTVDGVTYSVDEIMDSLEAEDVSEAFDEMFQASDDAEARTGLDNLIQRYQEMLNQECDWIDLFNLELWSHEFHVKIVAIKVGVNLIVRGNVNLAMGADLEYQVGKRYIFWLHIMDLESGSNEIDLIDERFGFQFYIMGTLGLKAGIKAEISFGLISTSIASIGATVEFGTYLKLYGYFIYYFERLRQAGSSTWEETEEMMGALYVDFGLYVTVNFKAQVLGLLKYEPTLYNGEFPLVTVGNPLSAYDFALAPDKDDVLYIQDDDIDSSNGIAMTIPDIYLTMKTIHLVSGEKGQQLYDDDQFIITFTDSRFRFEDGKIVVDVPAGTRYMECDMRIVWKTGKLAFSKFDTDITVPVVWTNMSGSELNEKFTASVEAGNLTDGYELVWSERYSRVQTFDLPTEEEILGLIYYYGYETDNGNLKYESAGGYQEDTTGLNLTTDRTWRFEITPKKYTVTVNGVQNADGTTETRTYTALYGESFDFSDLRDTGTNNPATNTYTSFFNLTDASGGEITGELTVDMAFAEDYGDSLTLTANYRDEALTATYRFIGLGNQEDIEVPFKKGTTPYLANLDEIVGDASYEITPTPAPSENSVTYTVICTAVQDLDSIHTLTFNTNGGSAIKAQRYAEGNIIYQPTDPVRDGYTFGGWFSDEALTVPFDFTGARMPNQDMNLYAKWEPRSYTVSFDAVNGDDPSPITVRYGERYGTLPTLTNDTLRFLGWFTQAEGGEEVTADTIYSLTENQTLYARWAEKIEIQSSWFTITQRTYDYNELEPGFPVDFTFNPPENSGIDLTAEDFTITYLWEKPGSEWTEALPVNAGGYLVKFSRAADDTYQAFEYTTDASVVSIDKISMVEPGSQYGYFNAPSLSVSNWVITVDTRFCGIKGDGAVTYELQKSNEYDLETLETGNTTGEFNVQEHGAGVYVVIVHVAEGTNYTAARSKARATALNDQGQFDLAAANSSIQSALAAAPAAPTETTADAPIPAESTDGVLPEVTNETTAETSSDTAMEPVSGTPANDTAAEPAAQVPAPTVLYKIAPAAYFSEAAPVPINLPASASAANATMTLSPEEVALNRGKEFEVAVELDQTTELWGILAAVSYDSASLELLGYTYGDIFTQSQFTVQEKLTAEPYRLLATLDEVSTISAKGNFIVLKFKVKDTAAEMETSISLETLEVVDASAPAAVNNGGGSRIIVDATAPVISGIQNGGAYFGDTTVTVVEKNVASVTVNGKAVALTNGQLTLSPANGNQTITVIDKAGNSTSVTVTVNPRANGSSSGSAQPKESNGGSGTGDNNPIALWLAALLASGGILGTLFLKDRQKKRRQK